MAKKILGWFILFTVPIAITLLITFLFIKPGIERTAVAFFGGFIFGSLWFAICNKIGILDWID